MDAEIIGDRLAAVEAAVLNEDERIDALESGEGVEAQVGALEAHNDRLAMLEEKLAECLAKLEAMETSKSSETEVVVALAEAETARAEAETASAEAIVAMVEAEQASLMTEELPEETVEEIEPEPESESAAVQERTSGNWFERLMALR